MDALLFALLLNLALDQGSGAQRLAARFGDEGALSCPFVIGLLLATALNGALAAGMGSVVAALLVPEARLLFLAMALALGGGGLIVAAFRADARGQAMASKGIGAIGRFALRRAGENAAFATAGVSAFTGAPIFSAAGAMIGGCIALTLPLVGGMAAVDHKAMRAIRALAGLALLCLAIGGGANAFHLA